MTSTTNTAIKSSTNTKKKTNYYAKWYYLKNRDKLNQRAKEYYHNVKKLKHDEAKKTDNIQNEASESKKEDSKYTPSRLEKETINKAKLTLELFGGLVSDDEDDEDARDHVENEECDCMSCFIDKMHADADREIAKRQKQENQNISA